MSIQPLNPLRKQLTDNMNRIELGKQLASIRKGADIKSKKLSAYSIQTIETGRTSYSIASLFLYTDAVGCSVYVWDYNIDEHYRIGSADDCHEIIELLLAQNGTNVNELNQKIGIRYSKPKDGQTLLSIDTLLAILGHFHCSMQFTMQHRWQE